MLRLVSAVTLFAALAPLAVPAQEASPEDRMTPMQRALTRDEAHEPYATYEGGAVTHGDLTARFSEREGFRVPMRWAPGAVADDIARRIAWERIHLDEALTEGVERGWVAEERIAQERRQVVLFHLLQLALAEVEPPTEAELRAHHAEHAEEFMSPLQFHMRHLFLPTYAQATVQEGESLTQIAQRVSGDRELARGIRLDNRRPVVGDAEILTLEEIDRLGAPRLRAGATVHVPMSEEARAEVRAQLEAIRADIETEEDFIAACREHTEGDGEEIGPLPDREGEFLPELLEAAQALEPGEVSEIIDTKHGVQLIMLTQKQPREPLPFEEVENQIAGEINAQRRAEAVTGWTQEVLERHGGRVHRFLEGSMRDVVGDSEVLAELPGGGTLTARELVEDFNALAPTIKLRWVDNAQFFMINQIFAVRDAFLDEEAESAALDWLDPLLEQQQLMLASGVHLDNLIRERAMEFTQEELQAYFDENAERFRPPTRVDFWQIRQRLDTTLRDEALEQAAQAQMASLERALEGIETLDDFKALLPTLSIDVPEGGDLERAHRLDIPVRTLGEDFEAALTEAPEGSIVGPLRSGWSIGAMWLEERREFDIPALEEIREQVEGQFARARFAEIQREMQTSDLDSIGFSLVRELAEETPAP